MAIKTATVTARVQPEIRGSMSPEQFYQMMEKGLNQAKVEQGMDLDAAFAQISERIGGL